VRRCCCCCCFCCYGYQPAPRQLPSTSASASTLHQGTPRPLLLLLLHLTGRIARCGESCGQHPHLPPEKLHINFPHNNTANPDGNLSLGTHNRHGQRYGVRKIYMRLYGRVRAAAMDVQARVDGFWRDPPPLQHVRRLVDALRAEHNSDCLRLLWVALGVLRDAAAFWRCCKIPKCGRTPLPTKVHCLKQYTIAYASL
jgi:hypothetical protein